LVDDDDGFSFSEESLSRKADKVFIIEASEKERELDQRDFVKG
jgi:hypothetical protein